MKILTHFIECGVYLPVFGIVKEVRYSNESVYSIKICYYRVSVPGIYIQRL